jgi:5'(3')-deoxyribonucleotidase
MTNQQKFTLYLDMDGVLADFNARAAELLGAPPEDILQTEKRGRWPKDQWCRLIEDQHFYRHLPKTQIADRVIDLALRFQDELGWTVRLLSAIPKDNDMPAAFHDKIDWFTELWPNAGFRVHFGPYSHDKHRQCTPGDILVDDRTSNCEEWRQAGGRAIQVLADSPEDALEQLERTFNLIVGFGG